MRIRMVRNLLILRALITCSLLASVSAAHATGLATCDSGPKQDWQPEVALEQMLEEKGWEVRQIKEDGGCYEVYALDESGQRVEAYFHPVSFELVLIEREED